MIISALLMNSIILRKVDGAGMEKKPKIILADTDGGYLSKLIYKFLTELRDNVDLVVITDTEYFRQYFEKPQMAELALIDKVLFSERILRHSINRLYILSDEEEEKISGIPVVDKYRSVDQIFSVVSTEKINQIEIAKKGTAVITFYSEIGGSGKTLLSMGLAALLSANRRRVLFISSESSQGFRYFISGQKENVSNETMRQVVRAGDQKYEILRNEVKISSYHFEYLPPIISSLSSWGLDETIYAGIVAKAKKSGQYNYIIIDIERGYSETKSLIMQQSEIVFLVDMQDELSQMKSEIFCHNMEIKNKEKFIRICNKYEQGKEDFSDSYPLKEHVMQSELIPLIRSEDIGISEILEQREMRKIASMLM